VDSPTGGVCNGGRGDVGWATGGVCNGGSGGSLTGSVCNGGSVGSLTGGVCNGAVHPVTAAASPTPRRPRKVRRSQRSCQQPTAKLPLFG
jgi:hypothetical protein